MKKHEIVREYLKRFPNHADLTMAKKIYAENSLLFTNVEGVRSTIRSIKGKATRQGKELKDKSMYTEKTYDTNPYKLPQTEEEVRHPYILPKADNNILLISDLHIPYHNISAITAALKYGEEAKVNTIIINGDLIDFYQISRFQKDPRKRSIKYEFDATKEFLRVLRATFPNARIYWVKGNHCYIQGTEILTKSGFKLFKDLTNDDLVAQFDENRIISYAKPISLLKRNYNGIMYDIEHNYSRQIVTCLHDVVVNGEKKKANQIQLKDLNGIYGHGFLNNDDYNISDDMLRLLVNIVCDACIVVVNQIKGIKIRVQFKLSKQRKIENIKSILNSLGIEYTYKICKKSGINKLQPYYIRIYKKEYTSPIYDLLNGKKQFPEFFKKLSKRQAEIVINEIAITDGTIRDNSIFWSTTSKNDCETIQEMCLLNGINTKNKTLINMSGFDNGKTQNFLKIRINETKLNKSIKQFEYDGIVNCVEMPLGTVITRYNGKVAFSGNCNRYEHWLMAKAPEVFDDPYYKMEERLRLNEERIHLIGDKTLVKAGKLNIHHGHLFFRGFIAPVNSARGLFLKAKESTICSHVHKISEHTETKLSGELTTCWSTGCLCELSPDYSPFANNYAHGFAHILVNDDRTYSVKNFRILNGKIL